MEGTGIAPVDLGGGRTWSIVVEVLRERIPVEITKSMRAGEPMDGALYSARVTRRVTSRDGARVTEYAPTIIEHSATARENVYLRALRMAMSARRKLARQHSVSERSDGVSVPLFAPMLATSLQPSDAIDELFARDDNGVSHIFVQRKYDGLRAIGTVDGAGVPILYGRRAIIFASQSVSRIKSELARIVRVGTYIDGELYVHGMSLQEIESAATNRSRQDAPTTLNFIAYDIFDGGAKPFSERLTQLRAILDEQGANAAIQCAETFTCARHDGSQCVRDLFTRFLREGYEGAIARYDGRAYEHGRSSSLVKIKLAHDAEYRVVAFTSAMRGSSRGALLFVCEISRGGATFVVTPTGSISARRALMKEVTTARGTEFAPTGETKRKWLGKYIVVRFDALSRDGIPLRARTSGFIRAV